MDKKKILLITVLALLIAAIIVIMNPKKAITPFEIEDKQIKETIFENSIPVNKEAQVEENVTEEKVETDVVEKHLINKNENKIVKSKDSVLKDETPIFKKLEVKEEITKVEEAGVSYDDPGIINENGVIVVTRDFKMKSPRKYSFKDFGVLAEPPVR